MAILCRQIAKLLSFYLEGELKPAVSQQVQHHLNECPCCTNRAANLRRTVSLIRVMGEAEPVPEPAHQQLWSAIQHEMVVFQQVKFSSAARTVVHTVRTAHGIQTTQMTQKISSLRIHHHTRRIIKHSPQD